MKKQIHENIEKFLCVVVHKLITINDVQCELQDQHVACPFTQMWSSIDEKMEKVVDMDNLVNYGLLLMILLLAVSSWSSR